jgi:hypothetical protein
MERWRWLAAGNALALIPPAYVSGAGEILCNILLKGGVPEARAGI